MGQFSATVPCSIRTAVAHRPARHQKSRSPLWRVAGLLFYTALDVIGKEWVVHHSLLYELGNTDQRDKSDQRVQFDLELEVTICVFQMTWLVRWFWRYDSGNNLAESF